MVSGFLAFTPSGRAGALDPAPCLPERTSMCTSATASMDPSSGVPLAVVLAFHRSRGALPGHPPPEVFTFMGIAASGSVGTELGAGLPEPPSPCLDLASLPCPRSQLSVVTPIIPSGPCFWLPFAIHSVLLGIESSDDFPRCSSDQITVVPAAGGILGVSPPDGHPALTFPSPLG